MIFHGFSHGLPSIHVITWHGVPRGERSYLIANACPEIAYNEAAFTSGRVERFRVQDVWPLGRFGSRFKAFKGSSMGCRALRRLEICSHRGVFAREELRSDFLRPEGLERLFRHFRCAPRRVV